MKSVFKKNQVIITALAIMLAVAGYLNFTKEKAAITDDTFNMDNTKDYQSANTYNTDNEYANIDTSDISDEDMLAALDENKNFIVGDNGEIEVSSGDSKTTNDTNSKGNGDNLLSGNDAEGKTDVDTAALTDKNKDIDNSTGSQPGEAILASTVLDKGFFSNAKLTREQTRSKNREMLMELASDETISEENRQKAIDSIVRMAEIAELENAAELLLEAKGFEGAVVNIASGNVDVVINAASITDAQVAQIEDIVTRKTQIGVENIVITYVVTEE